MVKWRVAALFCMAAFAAVCSAQDTAATIEEADTPARRNPRDDELPPPTLRRPQRPPSSSGSWSSLLSGNFYFLLQDYFSLKFFFKVNI